MSDILYKHAVQFIPRGVSPRETETLRTIEFTHPSLDMGTIRTEAHTVARREGEIDPYALRNHWEIFHMEVEFNDPPWDSFWTLCETLLGFSGAHDWKQDPMGMLFMRIEEGKEQKFMTEAEQYYSGLNPQRVADGLVELEATPVYRK